MRTNKLWGFLGVPLVMAFVMALLWSVVTRDMYSYNMNFASVLHISVFPLIGWTIALTVGFALIQTLIKQCNIQRRALQLTLTILLYVIGMLVVETIGYHVVGIQNLGTSQYTGLPYCNCLHAPIWMQFGYFVMGPIHWVVVNSVMAASMRFSRPIS